MGSSVSLECAACACFFRKLWAREKIRLKSVKPLEMTNLPWDREKGSESVGHTLKPWEFRGLHHLLDKLNNGNTRTLCKICSKIAIKQQQEVVDVVLICLLLTFNIFHTTFFCFHCCHWISKGGLRRIGRLPELGRDRDHWVQPYLPRNTKHSKIDIISNPTRIVIFEWKVKITIIFIINYILFVNITLH